MNGPSEAGFVWFIQNIMGISTTYLPSDAPVISWSYNIAVATVSQWFQLVPSGQLPNSKIIYTQMVYNLAGHNLVSWAPDVSPPPTPPYKVDQYGNSIGYFQYLRQQFNLNNFVAGVVTQAVDVNTSTTLTIPESLKNLTIQDLALTQTPWGRTYLGLAQAWNRPWGIS